MSKRAILVAGMLVLGVAWPGASRAAPPLNDFLKQPLLAEATIGSRGQAGPVVGPAVTGLDGFTAAPMPDVDRSAPTILRLDPDAARLAPSLFHKQTTYKGEGYVFGSTVQEEQDRRVTPAPGINLIMPLH